MYCLVVGIPSPVRIPLDSLDPHDLRAGVYVYVVESAHSGIEAMVAAHRSKNRRLWCHIDYLLEHGEIISTVAVPFGSKEQECETFRLISSCELADKSVAGFGSFDRSGPSRLVYFGEVDPERVVDMLVERLSLMADVYPARVSRSDPDRKAGLEHDSPG